MNILDNPKYSHLLKRQPFYHRIGKTLLYNWARFIFSWYTPLKVYGTENIPSESFIFSSNHNAHLDVIALSLAAKKTLMILVCLLLRTIGLIILSEEIS